VGDVAAAEGALAKIRRVLPAALSRRLDALVSSAEYTSAGRSGTPADTAVLLALAEATRARRTVVVDYTSWDGSSGERALDCYGLVFHSGRWYATGHDHRRGEVRTFRVDRVARIVSVGDVYPAPDDFDAVEQVVTSIASVAWTHQVVVTLHAPMEQVRARLPASVGRLSEVPSGVRLEAGVERLAGMALLLAGLGWPFTVEQPDTLRSEVAALADRLREDAARAPTVDHPRPLHTLERGSLPSQP
jgi:predicted DNA-binding transcriptional regulator YafY